MNEKSREVERLNRKKLKESPAHVGLFLDGNYWYKKINHYPWEEFFYKSFFHIADLINWILDDTTTSLTLFINLPQLKKNKELKILENLLLQFNNSIVEFVKNNKIAIKLYNEGVFSSDMIEKMNSWKISQEAPNLNLNLIFFNGEELKNDDLKNLSHIDVLIRTGMEKILYPITDINLSKTHLFFLNEFWVEFNKNHLQDVFNKYKKDKLRHKKLD